MDGFETEITIRELVVRGRLKRLNQPSSYLIAVILSVKATFPFSLSPFLFIHLSRGRIMTLAFQNFFNKFHTILLLSSVYAMHVNPRQLWPSMKRSNTTIYNIYFSF